MLLEVNLLSRNRQDFSLGMPCFEIRPLSSYFFPANANDRICSLNFLVCPCISGELLLKLVVNPIKSWNATKADEDALSGLVGEVSQ